jgi:U3 small nucleolar RNA-associated protein 20
VRRVRHYVDDEETTKSFFKSSLDNWSERNLSATFASFVREIKPLCECLPLILHHQDAVFEMLHSYIKKHDAHALKPLLDLLAQFAHDLGANFEPYLSRAVALLVGIVTKHVEAETIEWAFNCLAYLLKYLSRLLVPDLRPLYDILAPLLGRENQKSFVTRFSAEALSFLVRKAKGESLELIVQHCLVDLQNTAGTAEAHAYPYGLMSMFYEAAISVDRTIHSRGPQLFGAMMNTASDQPDSDGVCAEVVLGVLTRLIHHTAPETFQPILDVVLKFIHADLNSGALNTQKTSMAAKLLYICVSVRKGRRVQNWIAVSDAGAEIVARAYKLPPGQAGSKETMWHALKAVAIVLQTAGTDVIILKCNRIVQKAKGFQV